MELVVVLLVVLQTRHRILADLMQVRLIEVGDQVVQTQVKVQVLVVKV